MNTFYPFQEEAIQKMEGFLKTNFSTYNACEQGLGKSVQAIELANRVVPFEGSTLIICPAVMLYTWKKEIKLWGKKLDIGKYQVDPTVEIISKGSDFKEAILTSRYVVTTYGLAASEKGVKVLGDRRWTMLICDEAHYLKNPKAIRTKQILKHIWGKAKYKVALSGTPFTQSVVDCYPVFARMYPDFGTFYDFADKYAKASNTPWGVKYSGLKNHEELRSIIKSNFFLRYLKEDVLPDLPAKTFQQILLGSEFAIKMSKEEETEHKEYLSHLKAVLAGKKGGRIPQPPKAIATKRREQALKKVDPIVEFVENLLSQNEPVVLFAYHREIIRLLAEKLKKYNPVLITGDTAANDRAKVVEEFQGAKTDLFIGQIAAAGVGITLTRSRVCVLAELDWSPAVIAQAVDRLHRISQRNAVDVYFFTVEGSVEVDIQSTLMNKSKTFKTILE